jgi:hypothetical protein
MFFATFDLSTMSKWFVGLSHNEGGFFNFSLWIYQLLLHRFWRICALGEFNTVLLCSDPLHPCKYQTVFSHPLALYLCMLLHTWPPAHEVNNLFQPSGNPCKANKQELNLHYFIFPVIHYTSIKTPKHSSQNVTRHSKMSVCQSQTC